MERVLREMAELIALPSVSSVRPELDLGNVAVIERLASWFAAEGFSVEVMAVDEPGRAPKANLVATRGRGPGGLVLAGHTDTVPYDAGRWTSDPFALTARDGRLYGLGTADMKGFFALVLEAARRTRGMVHARPLTVLATADEECGMAGARALVAAGRAFGTAAVIGEPTSMRPVRMHKGVTMESLKLRGRSGHSSDPSLGVSALEGMRAALNAVCAVRDALQRENVRAELHPPVPTLNLGNIHGGDNPNRICAECELQYDLRVLPGMDESVVREELRRAVTAALAGSGLAIEMGPLHEALPPFETAAGAAIVAIAEELTGHPAGAVAFGTEAPYFARMGLATVVLGPGDIEVAHQPDEHLREDRLAPCVELLTGFIARQCAEDPAS